MTRWVWNVKNAAGRKNKAGSTPSDDFLNPSQREILLFVVMWDDLIPLLNLARRFDVVHERKERERERHIYLKLTITK